MTTPLLQKYHLPNLHGGDEIIREADTSFLLHYSLLPITSKNRLRRKVKSEE